MEQGDDIPTPFQVRRSLLSFSCCLYTDANCVIVFYSHCVSWCVTGTTHMTTPMVWPGEMATCRESYK